MSPAPPLVKHASYLSLTSAPLYPSSATSVPAPAWEEWHAWCQFGGAGQNKTEGLSVPERQVSTASEKRKRVLV